MNVKTIIVGSLAIGLVIGGTLIKKSSDNADSVYTPRVVKEGSVERSAAGHAAYMHMLRQDPATGLIDPNLVAQAQNEVQTRLKASTNKASLNLNWTQMGPDNVGGRTRSILVDRFNSNTVYAGGVNGGLYISYDGSGNWERVAGHIGILGENLGVASITQTDNGRIFFGTGTTFEFSSGNGSSGHIGNGVYEYVPGTGQVLPILVHDATPPNISNGSISAVNAIAARGNRLYLGTRDGMIWADPDGNGDYPAIFGSWTNPIEVVPGLPETGTVNDIDIAPDGSMVVSFGNKIYLSNSDQLGTFTSYTSAQIPACGGAARICSAVSKSDPNWIYVVGSTASGVMTDLCISTNRGATWDIIVPGGAASVDPMRRDANATSGQGTYDMAIECNPSDRGNVLVGGIRVFEWNYNSGSNPIGGSWLLASTIGGGSPFNPFYIHADVHTFHWPTAGTIYVGSDGGINRSTDGGQTWQQRNLGFNVTTFYDAVCAANGWFIGGSQDNGNQMFTYQSFGENTPLGTTEVGNSDPNIIFGDGFDVAMSNIAGAAYATAQNSAVVRATGGAGVSFYDSEMLAEYQDGGEPFNTVIKLWENSYDLLSLDSVKLQADTSNGILLNSADTAYAGDTIFAGDTIHFFSLTNGIPLVEIAASQIILGSPVDSVMVQDPIQSRFVLRMSSGIYMTKDATRLNASSIQWHKISNTASAENFEFSNDGNHLFVGTSGGAVIRISGLTQNNDSLTLDNRSGGFALTQTTIATGLGGVVSLAVDPNNSDNMIAVSGGYTTGNHVYRCTNATTATGSAGNFTAIQGSGATALPRMPVYDAVVEYKDNDKVIVATEWGVWATDNAFSEATPVLVDWYDESAGAAHVPVHAIVQQSLYSDAAINSGAMYLGTHAQGFYMSTDLVTSINDDNNEWSDLNDNNFISNLSVYPNPISNRGLLEFDLNESTNAVVKIFNLNGKLVQTMNLGKLPKGNHKEDINVSQLSIGTYIVSLEAGNESSVAKFVVTR